MSAGVVERLSGAGALCLCWTMDKTTQKRIFILFVVIKICLAEEVKQNLTAVTGASITFPDPVKERGFLIFGRKNIASVSRSEFEIEEDIYTNRLHWSNNTGLFTITGLQKSDSGVYSIDSKKGTVFSRYYELKVYDPVALPVVTTLNVSDDRCILQCSVKKTEQTTLSWFRGEDIIVTRSSSEVLLLTVNQNDLTSEYLCVAANPADKKTVSVDFITSCNWTYPPLPPEPPVRNNYTLVYIIIPIVLTLLILLVAVIMKKKYFLKKESSLQTQDSVQYTEVNIRERGNNQTSAVDSSVKLDRSQLTTVYDKIEAHRIVSVYSNCGQEIT